jgi:hypothetical protein
MSWNAKKIYSLRKTKNVKLKDAFALEVEKMQKNLINELKTCNDSISCLKYENKNLIAKIVELNACSVSTSTVEHVTICTRCRDVDAISGHLSLFRDQNDHITKFNAKISEHELENEKFKFARSI